MLLLSEISLPQSLYTYVAPGESGRNPDAEIKKEENADRETEREREKEKV